MVRRVIVQLRPTIHIQTKWTMRSPMIQRRSGVAVGVLNGFLYALGGHDSPASNPSVSRTETVERYDPATDTWTMVK